MNDLEVRISQLENAAKPQQADQVAQVVPAARHQKYRGCSNCISNGIVCSLRGVELVSSSKPCNVCEKKDLPCGLYELEEPELDG